MHTEVVAHRAAVRAGRTAVVAVAHTVAIVHRTVAAVVHKAAADTATLGVVAYATAHLLSAIDGTTVDHDTVPVGAENWADFA